LLVKILKSIVIGAAIACAPLVPSTANAAVLSIVGDADCFGLGGSCPVGTLWQTQLGGVFFTSNATPSDGAFTDQWFAATNPTYALAYAGGTGVSVELKIAGIADNRGPWTVLFNGTSIGQLTTNTSGNAFQEVRLFNFAVASGLLQANNTVTFTTDGGDGYSVDYVALLGDVAGAVPEPSTWGMMIAGFGIVGASMRRRRQAVASIA
jgi:PEP-CTERM motif